MRQTFEASGRVRVELDNGMVLEGQVTGLACHERHERITENGADYGRLVLAPTTYTVDFIKVTMTAAMPPEPMKPATPAPPDNPA